MTPTPNLQDLVQSVRDEVPDTDLLGQLTKAAEYSASLATLGDRLLDHFVFQCRQAGMSWAELSGALGVSKQAAHKRFNTAAPPFQRLTVKAQAVMQGSTDQARTLGHEAFGTGHMLLALFEPSDSLAAIALAKAGVTRDAVLEQLLARNPAQPEEPRLAIPATAHAKTALRGSFEEAIGLGHNYIGTEHMLLSLISDPEYSSTQILTAIGTDPDAVRGAQLKVVEQVTQARMKQQS